MHFFLEMWESKLGGGEREVGVNQKHPMNKPQAHMQQTAGTMQCHVHEGTPLSAENTRRTTVVHVGG